MTGTKLPDQWEVTKQDLDDAKPDGENPVIWSLMSLAEKYLVNQRENGDNYGVYYESQEHTDDVVIIEMHGTEGHHGEVVEITNSKAMRDYVMDWSRNPSQARPFTYTLYVVEIYD